MLFAPDMTIWFGPLRSEFNNLWKLALGLLEEWQDADFAPQACRALLESALRERALPDGLFEPSAIDHGGRVATDALLFDVLARSPDKWQFTFAARSTGCLWSGIIRSGAASTIAEFIRDASHKRGQKEFIDEWSAKIPDDRMSSLISPPSQPSAGMWPGVSAPGIYRREHASLVFRTDATTIVTDPQGFQNGWTTNGARYPVDPQSTVADCVCLTHTHDDHWHLPSILRWGAPGTPLLAPSVPRINLLTPEDPAGLCRAIGVKAASPAWWTTQSIGDCVISVLPFYGEQPVRLPPAIADGLRNWGNCYRFDTPHWSAMILVDSGADPCGDAIEMIERSVAERGPVDVLMSCCFAFPEGINPGLPHYLLSLPFDRLRSIHEERKRGVSHAMTLGVEGVLEACRAARARYFLPYAHGFGGLGRDPKSAEGGRQGEAEIIRRIGLRLAEARIPTQLVEWKPGDSVHFHEGGICVRRAAAA